MVEIGDKPILRHIMKIYSVHGVNDFVICCGYKGYQIKEYFANYFLYMSDVRFYKKRVIPLEINYCVSLYPSEDGELELDEVDYLKSRNPNHVIGMSTHQHHDWQSSMLISYGKGARS